MNQQSTLTIDGSLLAVVVCSIKELAPCRVHSWQEGEALLDRLPFFQRVDANVLAGQAGDVKITALLFLYQTTERRRHLEPTLRVYPGRVVSPQHNCERSRLVGGR